MVMENVEQQNKHKWKQFKDMFLASQRRIGGRLKSAIRGEVEQACKNKLSLAKTANITINKLSSNVQMHSGNLPMLTLDGTLLVLDGKKCSYYLVSSELPFTDLDHFCAPKTRQERDDALLEFWRGMGRNAEFIETEFPSENTENHISDVTLARLSMYSDDFEQMFADLLRQRLAYRDFREQYFKALVDRDIRIEKTKIQIVKAKNKKLKITASATVYAEND